MSTLLTEKYSKELYHYGVLGMKWGVRRYQRRDGTLTSLGKKHVAENAGRYLDPDSSSNSAARREVATEYKRRTVNGETLSVAEGELYSYANATLKDLGLEESPKARRYIEDIFKSDPKMKELTDARDTADNEKEKAAKEELSMMSPLDQERARKIIDSFKDDNVYGYSSRFSDKIGSENVEFELMTRKGTETSAAIEATKFIKRFDVDKAKEGLAKEYYDPDVSWIDKDPSGDNYYTRDTFKKGLDLAFVVIDNNWKTYEAVWGDGGTYGWHDFVDEGSLTDMKVHYRSLQG